MIAEGLNERPLRVETFSYSQSLELSATYMVLRGCGGGSSQLVFRVFCNWFDKRGIRFRLCHLSVMVGQRPSLEQV